MAKNTVPIIIGAVVFGLLAIGLTLFTIMRGAAPTPPPGTAVTAQPAAVAAKRFVAVRPIYPRTVITSDMLEESDADSGAPNPNAITNRDDILGKLANRTIRAGETVTAGALTTPIARVIPANIPVPSGLRAVAIWVDPIQTAAGLVDAGDRVDVIVTHDLTLQKTGNQVVVGMSTLTSGRTIAQDIEVLAVDKSIAEGALAKPPATTGQAAAPAAGSTPAPTPAPTPAAVNAPPGQAQRIRVILAVAPEIAQRLVAANSKGQLHLTIRNPNSRERFPQPESREYPSRIAAGPPAPRAGAGQMSERQVRLEEAKVGADIFRSMSGRDNQPSIPPANLSLPRFNSGNQPPGPAVFPQAPMEKDVTVIRGPEKTRVVVPR